MRTGGVPVSEILAEGARLTGGFHLSEDQIAVSRLRGFRGPTSRVSELVRGRGVFRGPIFKRIYVEDPAMGEPYVSARDLVMADVRPTSFLSRKLGSLLDDLRLQEGMILVTCSGMNLGSAIWTRADLDGLVASHDLIRLCPDPDHVPPGYLHAFLASRYGRALIRKQIYGGNIKHVEPHHIGALAVPRLDNRVEAKIHDLILGSADMRTRAAALLNQASKLTESLLGPPMLASSPYSVVPSSRIQQRFDAYYYSGPCTAARARFDTATVPEHHALGEVATVFIPGIFKRRYADEREFGTPYLTGGDVFELSPRSERYLINRVANENELVVSNCTLLIQEAGQLGGLIGRSILVGTRLEGFAVSNNMVRVTPHERDDAGYLFAVLSVPEGVTLIAREAAGSSIPHMEVPRLSRVRVPWPERRVRLKIGAVVNEAIDLRDRACADEESALRIVENAIEAAV